MTYCTDDHLCRCPRCNGEPTDEQIADTIRQDIKRLVRLWDDEWDDTVRGSLGRELRGLRRELAELNAVVSTYEPHWQQAGTSDDWNS